MNLYSIYLTWFKRSVCALRKIHIAALIFVLLFFLYWHFKLGIVRYFDADEFAHLHWGYSFSIGERPYTDFFYLFPPFFLYPMAALFNLFGRSTAIFINARIFIFLVFAGTTAILFLIAKKMRNTQTALLTAIIFAFLPIPFDKMIEVRPDLLATGLAMLGMYLFIKAYEGNGPSNASASAGKGYERKYFFLSGLSYAASLGFVPKTVFFLVPVGLVAAVSYLSSLSRLSKEEKERNWIYFLLGMVPVGVILLIMLGTFGNLAFSLYSMTKMAGGITAVLGLKFFMLPNIFFYPNDTYYGFGGWSWPLILNLVIYLSAAIWAIHRFVTFNLGGDKGNKGDEGKRNLGEFLVAGSFWANLVAFTYFYPLKHAQYLIPVAPFIAFYFSDFIFRLLHFSQNGFLERFYNAKLFGKSFGNFSSRFPSHNLATKSNPTARILLEMVKVLPLLIILLIISVIGFQMNQRKEKWANKETLDKTNYFLATIPAREPVFDLTGETVFFPNGYYFCCLPYGQYAEALYFKIPEIEKDMQRRGTKYVYLGGTERLNVLPARQAKYIRENFNGVSQDKTLLIKNN